MFSDSGETSVIMPCFSISCAAAFVSTVNKINGRYFMPLSLFPVSEVPEKTYYSMKNSGLF